MVNKLARFRTRIISLTLVALLGLSACSSMFASTEEVSGFIQTSKTDEDDLPVEIFLFDGQTDYLIKKEGLQKELLELVDRKVAITGPVQELSKDKKVIEVESYRVLD